MSDTSSSSEPSIEAPKEVSNGEPLWLRFVYMIGYGILGNIAFSLALFLGVVQIVLLLIRKELNDEIAGFSRNLIAYVGECLSYVAFVREDKPFPLAKFPSSED
ncbi:MAG: DUF4389 domain-containing protein [Parvibaculum sp.]|nr:DUF4389 domain-containing protein [Parvibaculum sp.]